MKIADAFPPVAKIYKAQLDRDRNMGTILKISVAHGQPFSAVRISTSHSNSILVHFVG